ncbi:MAG: MazG nucleotide pyrophosphohydrolase domain-containing protein [Candidatus Promineifilaceae bacterium]|nr:MazG nucleotide pyrophosphohydrolase domain-containing protein [Candidatus Promineifilaceae bacterium]
MAPTNWQQQATAFAHEHELMHDPTIHALDLVSEVGETAKALLLATQYGQRPLPDTDLNLNEELGDALYSLCLLSTACGVDLETAFRAALAKYARRFQSYGAIGNKPS